MAHLDQFDISDSKKRYIQEEVNPLLEELVRNVLTHMPEEPLQYMIKYLKEKTGKEEYDLAAIAKENETLEKEIKQMHGKLEEVSAKTASALGNDKAKAGADDEEEEEEDDDDVDEIPDTHVQSAGNASRARTSVSAEAYGQWNQKKEFTPPVYPKTDEQKKRISAVMLNSFLFSSLEEKETNVILDAVKEVIVEPDQRIIKQGDNGDFMFVCESGALECYLRDKEGNEKMVKAVEPGDAFGELALLYNCPRAASVQAKTKAVCWQLDRDTFNNIVKEAAAKKRERHTEFFNKVPLLNSVDAYGRSQVADALKAETYAKGVAIIKQGETGDKFYIIEAGECEAKKTGDGADQVMALKEGDYFGELALLNNEPRAANITATSNVKVLTLDRRAFNRLLGPLREKIMNEANRYK